MKPVIIVLIFVCLFGAVGWVAVEGIKAHKDCPKWYQYRVEIGQDSLYIYDAEVLLKALNAKETGQVYDVLLKDNE